ncbi:MAG: translation elongation factor Ts [Symbiobacteriaceae bacterium]|nr:translation elongation factor Ts [Symbiobacteriaceae bacterium]
MIPAATVKELRERTGAGMMDCKRALEQCDGDMEKAIEFLREKGLATAAKKAGRVAKQGIIFGKRSGNQGLLLELNCETDFVAKNEEFQKLGNDLAELALVHKLNQVEPLLQLPFEGVTVQAALTNRIATLGENMAIRRVAYFDAATNGLLDLYLHGGGRIAVMVLLEVSDPGAVVKEELNELVHDLALQIVASKAQYIASDDIPEDIIEKEKQIYKAQAINEGRPENIAVRIVEGRLRKFFEEVCLLNQEFIKEGDLSVGALMAKLEKATGVSLKVGQFVRFEIGEGIADSESE